ncbi:MAG: HlyD family efflux transporter periplasmic adaptor subunit [Erysipelotrichia bacterium]|jgi:multidrug efflux pump subunit AcrA (membrane-fusion protein)|nr:HlyD family efflux transporter periplasmic adaptor subunit [Erysipelotrichia bacterium]
MAKTKRRSKWIKRGVILALIVGVGAFFFIQQQTAARQRLIDNTKTTTIELGQIELFALASGKLTSSEETSVNVSGTLSRTLVKVGDRVTRNQRIGETRDVMGNTLAVRASRDGIITSLPSALNNAFVISNPNKFKLVVNISERDVSRLSVGQSAEIFIQSLNLTFQGEVSDIGLIGNTSLDFTTYPVTVVFDHGDEPLFLGMSASARISVSVFEDILIIPFEALIIDGTQRYVLSAEWLKETNRPQREFYVAVTTGVADIYNVQVSGENLEGLSIIVPDPSSSFPFFRR